MATRIAAWKIGGSCMCTKACIQASSVPALPSYAWIPCKALANKKCVRMHASACPLHMTVDIYTHATITLELAGWAGMCKG